MHDWVERVVATRRRAASEEDAGRVPSEGGSSGYVSEKAHGGRKREIEDGEERHQEEEMVMAPAVECTYVVGGGGLRDVVGDDLLGRFWLCCLD